MKTTKTIRPDYFQLCGWLLFVFSALFFITSSIRVGDIMSLTGGVLFLIACFVFLIPLTSAMRPMANPDSEPDTADTETPTHN